MKARELYARLQEHIDGLQKQVKNCARDQVLHSSQLMDEQQKLHQLMELIIKDGDRDLTAHEVLFLGGEEAATAMFKENLQ